MYFRPRNKIYQIALYKNFNKPCLVYYLEIIYI